MKINLNVVNTIEGYMSDDKKVRYQYIIYTRCILSRKNLLREAASKGFIMERLTVSSKRSPMRGK